MFPFFASCGLYVSFYTDQITLISQNIHTRVKYETLWCDVVGLLLPGSLFLYVNDWNTHTTKNKLEVILLVFFNSISFPPHYINFQLIRSVQSQSGNLEVHSDMICEMSGTYTMCQFHADVFFIFLMTMIDLNSVWFSPMQK